MNDYGLVSIITPSYNTGKFIEQTIQSVINQTYEQWEMIIVDDCSTDNTEIIVKGFNDTRIRFIKNSNNSGAAISRNRALREAKGEWIAFLDSDDIWTPDKLEKQLSFMIWNNYSFSCAYSTYINEQSEELGLLDTCPKKINRRKMLMYNWIGCLTAMYHYPEVGLIQIENIPKRNDYAIWLEATKKVDCYCTPEILGKYRVREKSVSHTSVSKLVKAHYDMFRKCEKMNVLLSLFFTGVNMVMSVIRKKVYVKAI